MLEKHTASSPQGQNQDQQVSWGHVTSIALSTTLYLMSWQFAQFTLFTQVAVIFGLYALGIISEATNVKMVSFGVLVSLHLVLRNEVNTKRRETAFSFPIPIR